VIYKGEILMDLDVYDGYEFESLICDLFRRMGFDVEQTPLSGDGGVDVIALSQDPIYSGKYLIQCKRWRSSVGEPAVRDLYGVVLSQNANKGIIITSSYFTDKARDFVHGKNLELIDGKQLNGLLKKYGFEENVTTEHIRHFTELLDFDKDKYQYLKERINENKGDKKYYDSLRNFFHSYIISNQHEIIKSGLVDEYINFNDEIIKRFCKKTKLNLLERSALEYINGYLYLLKGRLAKAIEIFNELNLFNFSGINLSTSQYLVYYNRSDDLISSTNEIRLGKSYSKYLLLKNLFMLFHRIGLNKEATEKIEKRYIQNREKALNTINYSEMNDDEDPNSFEYVGKKYTYAVGLHEVLNDIANHYTIKNTNVMLREIKNGNCNLFHFPTGYDIPDKASWYGILYEENVSMDIDTLIEQYLNCTKEEKEKVAFILSV